MVRSETEYGVGKAEAGKYGEFVARMERALEVLNSFDDESRFVAEWRRSSQVTIFGDGVLLLSYGEGGLAFPDRFEDLMDDLAIVIWSVLGEDWDIFNKKFLLERARQMEEEGVDRERMLAQIETSFNSIFRDEVSRKAAEDMVLQQWSKALGVNGWVVSGMDLRKLTRLPILGNDQILIYHGSARHSPRYFRVCQKGGISLERIEADDLGSISRARIVGVEEMDNEEIRIVVDVLAGMCPQEEHE